jgi:hypothetical protein
MALSFPGLSAYTKQLVKPLLTSAVFGAKTQQLIKDGGIVIPNAKSSVAIPLMDTDAVFGTQSCGWNPSGTTTFTQRTITVGKIKIEEAICVKDLESFFTQEALKAGSTYEDFSNADFQAAYLDKKNVRIASQLETALWNGDTGSATANLNKFDGLIKLRDAGSPVLANTSGFVSGGVVTTVSASNVIAATEGVYKAIPAAIINKGDVKIFVGNDWYRLLLLTYVSTVLQRSALHRLLGGMKVWGRYLPEWYVQCLTISCPPLTDCLPINPFLSVSVLTYLFIIYFSLTLSLNSP